MSITEKINMSFQELAGIMDALDVSTIIAVTDAHGMITYVNEAFCTISQYSREELIGQTHQLVRSDHHPHEFFQDLWATIRQGRIWRGTIKNKAKDGTFYWVATTIVPSLDKTGKPLQYTAIRHDVTRQMQAEESLYKLNNELECRIAERTVHLEQAKQEAETANQLKTRVLSFVSHDFKNPLASMKRFIDILENDPTDTLSDKQRELIGYIAEGVFQLRCLVLDILDKARLEEGKMFPTLCWIELRPFLDELKPLLDSMACKKNISIRIKIQPNLTEIEADTTHLRQIIINLISNAVKYNRPNGKVFLRVYKAETDQFVVIEVQDTGIGMSSDQIPQLFVDYYRAADLSQANLVEGTGLGLPFIKKLIDLHGGMIQIESEVDVGSTFKVLLPLTLNKCPLEASVS